MSELPLAIGVLFGIAAVFLGARETVFNTPATLFCLAWMCTNLYIWIEGKKRK